MAKKEKDISIAQSREQNEAERVANDEGKKTLLAKLKNDEETRIAFQATERGALVAEKNKDREIAVETERVEKARQLEVLTREREVEVSRFAKDKELEVKRKEIADVIRGRIAVDKTVAEEEERIKDLRAVAEATRHKDVVRITAEAAAQEMLVKQVKAAEAAEEVAKHQARTQIISADADLESSDKAARAKIRVAEGTQAEVAAPGLAEVRVREAATAATEKQGMVEARVSLEKMQAVAAGEEKQGLARVKVREAEAAAIEKQGLADALVTKEKLLAEAQGAEQKGLANARVQEAEAGAIEKRGHAEAGAVREKLVAEAVGLAEKAAAMKALDGVGREHEEFRLRLDMDRAVAIETIHTRKDIAEAQAKILAQAFGNAKIQIVGGDGQFFDRFVKAVSVSQSIAGAVDNSETVRNVLGDYLNGNKRVADDIKDILAAVPVSSESVKNLTISALLARLMTGADEPGKKKIRALAERAKDLGIDEIVG